MSFRPVSVAVAVRDRRKAARWYAATLGFHVVDDGADHWTTVGPRGGKFLLHLCEVRGRTRRPLPKSEVGNTGILLITNEPFLKTCERLRRRRVRFTFPPKKLPWGWVARFLDPDGNEFWLNPAS